MAHSPSHSGLPLPVENDGRQTAFPREVWKSPPTWRGIDRRPGFLLAELADVEVEYSLADEEPLDAVEARCPSCLAPSPPHSHICTRCGHERRWGQRIAPLAPTAVTAGKSNSSAWIAIVERIAQRILPMSRALCIRDRAFNDRDLLRLTRLRRYRSLDFEGTQISDDSVERLAQLRKLSFLIVRGTRISPDGVAHLRCKLTKCEVID